MVQNIESVISLGNSIEGMSAIVSAPIVRALPDDQMRRFDQFFREKKDSSCKLQILVDFLKNERNILERINARREPTGQNCQEKKNGKQKNSGNDSYKSEKFDKSKNHHGWKNGKNEHAFAAVQSTSKPDHSCVFCGEEHSSSKCKKKDERRGTSEGNCYPECVLQVLDQKSYAR